MAMGDSEVRVFRCHQCGTPLQVDPTAPAVRCSGCNATVAIPEAVRADAYRYMNRVAEAQRRVDRDAKFVSENAYWHTPEGKKLIRRFSVLFLFMTIGLTVGTGLLVSNVDDPTLKKNAFLLPAAIATGFMALVFSRANKKRESF